ncbi:MAG: hypothetical protein HDT02_01970 [Bacteroidales bacterium]|nr:hypothetical protein [Bacteroidales bacterium]
MAMQKQLVIAAERLPGFAKKLVDARTLAEWDDEDGFVKGFALIRVNLHVDIDKIETEEEWALCYCQAI